MDIKDLSKLAKFSLIFFAVIYSIFIVIATISCRGGFLDGNNIILCAMQELCKSDYGFFHMNHRWRGFSLMLYALPMNITYWIIGAKKIPLLYSYYFGLFFSPFLILIFQYFLSKRLKNAVSFLISSFFFIFFIMVQFAWGISELPIASMLYLLLATYFVSNDKLKVYDYIIIFLLSVFLLWSHEIVVFIALLFLVFSILFYRKYPDSENNKIRFIITFFAVVGAFAILLFSYSMPLQNYNFNEVTNSLKMVWENFYISSFLISLVGIALLIKSSFSNKEITKKEYFIGFSILLFICGWLSYILNKPNYNIEMHFKVFAYPIAVFVIFALLAASYFEKKLSDFKLNNFIIIIFVVGIAQTIHQINTSILYHESVHLYMGLINNSKERILYINPDQAIEEIYKLHKKNFALHCFGYAAGSIALSKDHKIKTIGFPTANAPEYCSPEAKIHENNVQLSIQTANYDIKNPLWDLTDIKTAIIENQRQ